MATTVLYQPTAFWHPKFLVRNLQKYLGGSPVCDELLLFYCFQDSFFVFEFLHFTHTWFSWPSSCLLLVCWNIFNPVVLKAFSSRSNIWPFFWDNFCCFCCCFLLWIGHTFSFFVCHVFLLLLENWYLLLLLSLRYAVFVFVLFCFLKKKNVVSYFHAEDQPDL